MSPMRQHATRNFIESGYEIPCVLARDVGWRCVERTSKTVAVFVTWNAGAKHDHVMAILGYLPCHLVEAVEEAVKIVTE